MTHIRKLLPSLRRLPVLAGALALSLALAAPAGADIAFPGSAGCGRISPPPAQTVLLDGVWTCQTPQGPRSIRFSQSRYASSLNGQVVEEGLFLAMPDGRFHYWVTVGPHAGRQGVNRYVLNGQTFIMKWDSDQALTFVRQGQGQSWPDQPAPGGQWNSSGPPAPGAGSGLPAQGVTPLEGRWVWAKTGPVSFGFIFQGSRFQCFFNGQVTGAGTFELNGAMLVMHHETGSDAGRIDRFACQLQGSRMLLFVSDKPGSEPIPYVRQ